jgi:transcriptional regulator with XRE-family HTH domain
MEDINDAVRKWLNQKFLDWQIKTGKRQTLRSFAKFLDVKEQSLSGWMNGSNPPSGENLQKIAFKLGFEIYDLVGKVRPGNIVPFSSLPPELQTRLTDAMMEISATLKEKNVKNEDEAFSIASEIFASHSLRASKSE